MPSTSRGVVVFLKLEGPNYYGPMCYQKNCGAHIGFYLSKSQKMVRPGPSQPYRWCHPRLQIAKGRIFSWKICLCWVNFTFLAKDRHIFCFHDQKNGQIYEKEKLQTWMIQIILSLAKNANFLQHKLIFHE